jgi:hypothetical protein
MEAPRAGRVEGAIPAVPAGHVLASASLDTLPLRVELLKLLRQGEGVIVLECALVNTSATEGVTLDTTFADAADRGTIAGVSLFQETGPKRFFVLRDDEGRPAGAGDTGVLGPGERRILRAMFPAPSPAVDHLTVEFPGLPPFRNVPIEGATGTEGRPPTY